MANRNRNAGHAWERQCMHYLKEVGFKDTVTTRNESRTLDNKKIDLTKCSPLVVQAKSLQTLADYVSLLRELENSGEEGIPVVMHKKTKKTKTRFLEEGQYALLNLKDFLWMIQILKKNNLL